MTAYYNEIDPYAAQWMRNLMAEGHIAKGDVDERSIEDVKPDDLRGYTQCHFFAGIGVWSYALRNAGWPDDRPVWTGSCPCQPFSSAGKGKGADDERHLWPSWFHLIRECKPTVIFGEQVEAAINHGWLDLVQSDMEGEGYTCGAACTPAAGFGAPHIRQRLWFVAESESVRSDKRHPHTGCRDKAIYAGEGAEFINRSTGMFSGVADTTMCGCEQEQNEQSARILRKVLQSQGGGVKSGDMGATPYAADWLQCRDGKRRPVEPGTFPLAYGVANRVGRLRAYGNAICAPQAEAFVRAYMS